MQKQALLSMNTLFLKACRLLINNAHINKELNEFINGLDHAIEHGDVSRELRADFKAELLAGSYFKHKDELRDYMSGAIRDITHVAQPSMHIVDFYEGLFIENIQDRLDNHDNT